MAYMKPGKGPGQGGARGRRSGSIFGGDDLTKNIGISEAATPEEQEFYDYIGVPMEAGSDKARFTDTRSKLFGFGPRLGTNNAARLNAMLGIEGVFGDAESARALREAQGLSAIDISKAEALLGQEGSESALRAFHAKTAGTPYSAGLGSALTGQATSRALAGQSLADLDIERNRGGRDIYQSTFPDQRRQAMSDAIFGRERAGQRADYAQSPEGYDLYQKGLGGVDISPALAAAKLAQVNLSSGDATIANRLPGDILKDIQKPGIYFNPPPEQFYQSQNIGGQTFLAPHPSTRAGSPGFRSAQSPVSPAELAAAGVAPPIGVVPPGLVSPAGQPLNTQFQGVPTQGQPATRGGSGEFIMKILRDLLSSGGEEAINLKEAKEGSEKADTLQKKYEEKKKKKKAEAAK